MTKIYALNPAVAIEDCGERSLALHCEDLRLVELNATARDLLARLDGQSSVEKVAASVADDFGQSIAAVMDDVRVVLAQMAELGIVERVDRTGGEESNDKR